MVYISGFSNVPAPFTLITDAQPNLFYLTIHKVYTDNEEVCSWLITFYSRNSQNQTINACELVNDYWPNGPDGEILSTHNALITDLKIYPNPAKNSVQIKSKSKIKNIYLYDTLGKLVAKNSNKDEINISNLNQGLYIMRLEDVDGNFSVEKIMKK